jgi:nicotinate-nucleotide adenylyltransferase
LKIGLFGGTFNPVHFGHLRAAEEIRESFSLDKIIFIPLNLPPHKNINDVISSHHRFTMLENATKENSTFSVSKIEMERSGKSYSIETIKYFLENFNPPPELFFILGVDAFLDITTWEKYDKLFYLCNFIVMSRSGYQEVPLEKILPEDISRDFTYLENMNSYIHVSKHAVHYTKISLLDISSTKIRSNIKSGKSIKYLLSGVAEDYIKQNKLYKT